MLAAVAVKHLKDEGSEVRPPPRLERISCAGGAAAPGRRELRLGPLTLIGVRRTAGQDVDGFAENGYKIPVVVSRGAVATLAAARSARPNVRFAYSPRTARRASREGIGGAPPAVRFEACAKRRSGFPGGIVIRHRGCYPLVVRVGGREPVRRRIPLGRPCRTAPSADP